MTALLVCWLASPVLLGILAQGCGTVVERLAGRALAAGVRIPCGVALMIAILDLATRDQATAHLAVAAVLAVAAAGLVFRSPGLWHGWTSRRQHAVRHHAAVRRGRDSTRSSGFGSAGGLAVAAIVFAVYAAPVVLSGMATWTGYIKLDDTATWLALIDRSLTHGRTLVGLPPSSYRATLASYLTAGYPLGSFLPVGIGHALLGQDSAWLVNPWMAFMAAVLAVALHRLAALCLGEERLSWRPIMIAVLAAQPALLYGYYLWGGMKEMAGAMLVAAFALTAPLALRGPSVRALIPAVVVLWALIAALSPGGLVWVGPGLLLTVAVGMLLTAMRGERLLSRLRASLPPRAVLAVAGIVVVAGAYLVLRPGGFVERFREGLTGGDELGNLVMPLSVAQVAGIWPAGDFRFAPAAQGATDLLIAIVVVCAVGGVAAALRSRRTELVLYVLCALAGATVVDGVGSPWLGAKALASASPALLLAALTGLAALLGRSAPSGLGRAAPLRSGLRILAGLGALAIGGGVLWSNVLAYHDVNLAPRAQFAELAAIGERIAGQGPTLMTEYQPYGVRHFLRDAAPEAPSELRMRDDPLITGGLLEKGESADIDQIQVNAVLVYRTLVLQRSPVASRPPSPYRLIFADRFWEVWQRPPRLSRTVIWHLPLGNDTHPGAVPRCATVTRLADRRGVRALIAEPVENPILISLAAGTHPASWSTGTSQLVPAAAGTARLTVRIARPGRYSVWLGGSIRGAMTLLVNGRKVEEAFQEIQESGQYVPFGELTLTPGSHEVVLRYEQPQWRPGTGGPPEAVGPLVLRREAAAGGSGLLTSRRGAGARTMTRAPLITVPVDQARSLCGRTLDWIEGVGAR